MGFVLIGYYLSLNFLIFVGFTFYHANWLVSRVDVEFEFGFTIHFSGVGKIRV